MDSHLLLSRTIVAWLPARVCTRGSVQNFPACHHATLISERFSGHDVPGYRHVSHSVQKTQGDLSCSQDTTGMRTGCRTPEGIRQDVAPHAHHPSRSRRGQEIPRTVSRQAHVQPERTRTPVFSRGADMHYAMARHALYFAAFCPTLIL